jgi:NAD+ synthase (glutamine-hydrolysing)
MNKAEFLDPRSHGLLRVAVVIPRVHLGNPRRNVEAHLEALEPVRAEGAVYAVCPELGISGYSLQDLFHSQALLSASLQALDELRAATRSWPMLLSVGAPLEVEGQVYNCAVTLAQGEILAVAPKSYPPEYREFYELRHFARASEARRDMIALLGEEVPFGADILIRSQAHPRLVIHTEVCEDLWVPIPPSTKAALAGATVLANLSASNITVGKAAYRERLVSDASAKNLAVSLYAAAGFGESTTDLAWDGDGYIAERGRVLRRCERFSMSAGHVLADVDLDSLILDRMRMSSFRQCASDADGLFREVSVPGRLGLPAPHAVHDMGLFELRREVESHPFVPPAGPDLDERCHEVFRIQATALARRLCVLSEASRGITIGVSGGQDSTHALLVACHAMDLLKLPRSRIRGITMPGFGTTDRTYNNACALVRAVGAELREIPIRDMATAMFEAIGHDPATHDLTYENTQAWLRKVIELATTSKEHGLDLGTGDLSELGLGWCTMFGDHASHYGVNSSVPKTLISHLIRWTAEVIFEGEDEVQRVLRDIVDTPVSPELLPPDAEGKIAQKTEEVIGPYELHDFFLHHFVRFGAAPSRIARLAMHAFDGTYDLATIKRWLELFLRRFFQNQFKRSCLPDGPKVGMTAVTPRGDWRMPSDVGPAAWLADLAKVPDLDG